MKSSSLMPGDIVILGPKLFGQILGEHTVIALGNERIADSVLEGVANRSFPVVSDPNGWFAEGFRLAPSFVLAPGAGEAAAFYANLWCVVGGASPTKYGLDRARGIKQYGKSFNNVAPPFNFDALFRSLKWASRNDEGVAFSRDKGITCCAFVTACYQSAVLLQLSFWDKEKIAKAFTRLQDLRVNKKDAANKVKRHEKVLYQGHPVDNYYTSGVSNVGMKSPGEHTLEGLIEEMLTMFFTDRAPIVKAQNTGRLTGADLFTSALGYDAKFYFTKQLQDNLRNDPMWTNLGSVEN